MSKTTGLELFSEVPPMPPGLPEWKIKEARMRERMMDDPAVRAMVGSAKQFRRKHIFPEQRVRTSDWAVPLGILIGALVLIPILGREVSIPLPQLPQLPSLPVFSSPELPTTIQIAMRQNLISRGVCESQANAFTGSEVTPEQISAMILNCHRGVGRNQLLMFLGSVTSVLALGIVYKNTEFDRPPEITMREKRYPFGYPPRYTISPSLKKIVYSKSRGWA